MSARGQHARMETRDPDEKNDPALQPAEEAGGGQSEGFEQAEDALIENATHGDGAGNPEVDAIDNEDAEAERSTAEYGEADEEGRADS
ncbi:MAG: hypothetical protein ACRDJY_09065 [Thermoleophilaceae bacterium]